MTPTPAELEHEQRRTQRTVACCCSTACGLPSCLMDTESGNEQRLLVEYAARQTKALENINFVLMALFVLVLIGIVIGLFAS